MLIEVEEMLEFIKHQVRSQNLLVRWCLMPYLLGLANGLEMDGGFKAHLIYFKGSDGKFYEGYVTNAPSNAGWMTPLINCKLHDGDMQDGNGTVGVFQLRRAVKLYDSNAKFVTVIPKDYFVSTKSGVSGQEYKSRMHITSYGYSDPSASGGFIELGDGGMTFDTFPLIGVLR